MTTTGKRIIARFQPQAWINDYAMNVDPEGPTEWDVTDHVLSMGKDKALALLDDTYDTDDLRDLPSAPSWVKNWTGPFYVAVESSVRQYFHEESSDPRKLHTPYRVSCPEHGPVCLTVDEYRAQMNAPDARWACPLDGKTADWDDDWYEEHADGVW